MRAERAEEHAVERACDPGAERAKHERDGSFLSDVYA